MNCVIVAIALSIAAVFITDPVAADCGTAKSHNLILGNIALNSKLIHEEHVQKHGWMFWTVDAVSRVEGLNDHITYVEVIDGYTDGNGGCTYIQGGGLFAYHLELYHESKVGHGLDFKIKVYTN